MFLLLDACIIIDAHSLGVWANLVETGEIVVPSIVIHDEAQFFETEQGMIPTPIDLRALLDENKIREASATAAEMRQVLDYFDRNTQEGLDPGEIEALAIIMQNADGDMRFCTADRAAVEAVPCSACPNRAFQWSACSMSWDSTARCLQSAPASLQAVSREWKGHEDSRQGQAF